MVHKFTDCTHNMLHTLNATKWTADLKRSGKADVTGYQEAEDAAQRATLKKFCADNNRGLYHPSGTGNPISWKQDVFANVAINRKAVRGTIEVHGSAKDMGIPADMNPARDAVYVGLRHKASGKKVLRLNVHPVAGATKPEHATGDSDRLARYKDWAVGQYWLDVVSFAASQMSLNDLGGAAFTSLWDILLIGGDYNGDLLDEGRWYYPANMLSALFTTDGVLRGYDHLQSSHGSDVKRGRRWSENGNTDHPIVFIERSIVSVTDFPGEK